MTNYKEQSNPGSKEALDQGCKCAVIDNHFGKGFDINGKLNFWITDDCPLHGLLSVNDLNI